MPDRTRLLQSLLALDRPLNEIVQSLGAFPWDSEEELACLKSENIANILARYLGGKLTSDDVEAWANAVESREDLGYEPGHELFLNDTLFQLANPSLTEALSAGLASELVGRLTSVATRG